MIDNFKTASAAEALENQEGEPFDYRHEGALLESRPVDRSRNAPSRLT
jgi:hypothetical protein